MPALFNTPLFNANLFGGPNLTVPKYSTDLVVFQGFSLADGASIFTTELLDSGPTRDILGGSIPRGDGQYINGDYWREKIIEAKGYVKASSASALDTLLD